MKYTQIINQYIKPGMKYLEIGIYDGVNYNAIKADTKVGVDPAPVYKDESIQLLTSDEFFASNRIKFDVIFIDGLHSDEQVRLDIQNALNHSKKNALIFLHDIEPETEWLARPITEYQFPSAWCGDGWKSFFDPSLHPWQIQTFDSQYGLGLIKKGVKREGDWIKPLDHSEMLQLAKTFR